MAHSKTDPNCVFCKILRGEIPSTQVLQTEHAVAFLDINPLNPGHTLLVPRAHYSQIGELPADLAAAVGALIPALCRAVKAATSAEGLNVILNDGRLAGQTIDHCHWHVIPRHARDSVHWPWPQGKYRGDEISQMQARIEHELAAADREEG